MILSHEHKFIFIKTAKTAGTSIEVFLSPRCGAKDIVTPIVPPIEGHQPRNYERESKNLLSLLRRAFTENDRFYNHMPASLVRSRVSADVWENYFKFCVERNPWDKVLSHYHMHAARAGGSLSLDEYLARGRFPINYFRYTDSAGRSIIVDRVVRYENLMDELAEVFARLGIPFDGSLGVRAKSEYRRDRTPYQSVFDERQRKIIEQAFAREIELHGYRF